MEFKGKNHENAFSLHNDLCIMLLVHQHWVWNYRLAFKIFHEILALKKVRNQKGLYFSSFFLFELYLFYLNSYLNILIEKNYNFFIDK